MNKVIILLILSDIFIVSSFGLISPIFAIFLKEGISGGSIIAVGIASTVYWLVKSLVQIPLSIYIDRKRNKISILLLGTFIIVLIPLFYALSPSIKFIFLAQGVYGLGAAMAVPSWLSLFTMHVDKKHRGLEWATWSTGIGLGTSLTAFLGAIIAKSYGFQTLFFLVSGFSFIGLIILFFLSNKYIKDVEEVEHFLGFKNHYHKH